MHLSGLNRISEPFNRQLLRGRRLLGMLSSYTNNWEGGMPLFVAWGQWHLCEWHVLLRSGRGGKGGHRKTGIGAFSR